MPATATKAKPVRRNRDDGTGRMGVCGYCGEVVYGSGGQVFFLPQLVTLHREGCYDAYMAPIVEVQQRWRAGEPKSERPASAGNAQPATYGTILAEPPWQYRNWSKAGERKNAARHYDCLSIDDLCALPVRDLAADDCALFLWVTGPFLYHGSPPAPQRLAAAWGFPDYGGLAFTWAKRSPTGKSWHFGPGYWTRHNAEVCLLFTRGAPQRLDRGVPELIEAPRREHSRKPDEAHERIQRLVTGPYLELFGRQERDGWTVLGNEVTGRDIRDDISRLAHQQAICFDEASA